MWRHSHMLWSRCTQKALIPAEVAHIFDPKQFYHSFLRDHPNDNLLTSTFRILMLDDFVSLPLWIITYLLTVSTVGSRSTLLKKPWKELREHVILTVKHQISQTLSSKEAKVIWCKWNWQRVHWRGNNNKTTLKKGMILQVLATDNCALFILPDWFFDSFAFCISGHKW